MKSYLKAIIIFDKNGEKRIVPLKQGVNIITGESKTGKSALIEILDYCLCSTRCTVPKGKITDFSYLYALSMVIGENVFIIARYNWESGGKMVISKESINYDPETLELNYFEKKIAVPFKEVQRQIECELGLLVTNTKTDVERKNKKASLRNMVSYLFQHQNLMASKFALFYRFSDYYKRKDIIDQFPVFAGMIDQKYYSDLIELNNLKTQLKQKYKKQQANEKSISYIKDHLLPLLEDYYALLGQDLDSNMSSKMILEIASDLPQFDDSQLFGESKISIRYSELKEKLEDLRDKEREILLKIRNIENVSHSGNSYTVLLNELKGQVSIAEIETSKYICPLCGHDCKEIAEEDAALIESTEWLDNELRLTEKYTADFSEDIRKLNELQMKIESEIQEVRKQIKSIERNYISSKKLTSKREQVNYAKARIELFVDVNNTGIFENVDGEILELEEKIKHLEEKIKEYDVETKMEKAQSFLSANMNRLSEKLDFEKEYRPINLNFGLIDESFDLYQRQNYDEKIYLYEMGSGANWVSCHIALFLSFLRLFAKESKSPMPLIMFFDQPSQVYFPQGMDNENVITQADLIAVNKMYQTIFDEIKSIGEDTGILPQLIVVDHVDGNNLECKDEFESYVRCNWRNNNALI